MCPLEDRPVLASAFLESDRYDWIIITLTITWFQTVTDLYRTGGDVMGRYYKDCSCLEGGSGEVILQHPSGGLDEEWGSPRQILKGMSKIWGFVLSAMGHEGKDWWDFGMWPKGLNQSFKVHVGSWGDIGKSSSPMFLKLEPCTHSSLRKKIFQQYFLTFHIPYVQIQN